MGKVLSPAGWRPEEESQSYLCQGYGREQKAKVKSLRNWASLVLVAEEAAGLYGSNEGIWHPSVSKITGVHGLALGKVGRAAFRMLPCCQFGMLLLLWEEWRGATAAN